MKRIIQKTRGLSGSSVLVVAKDQVSSDLEGEAVILNLASGVYYGLEEAGARIWRFIHEQRTIDEIRAIILDEYEVEPARCEQDLFAFLERLLDEGLIEIKTN